MSQENVEIVRRMADAFQRGDLEMAFEYYDAEIVWDGSAGEIVNPDFGGEFHGHEGVRTFWRRWLSSWQRLEFEVGDIRADGDDVRLLILNQRQWGRHSNIETTVPPYTMVFTFRGNKIVRFQYEFGASSPSPSSQPSS